MNDTELQKQIDVLLKKYGYTYGYKLDFPMYKILPDEVKLALAVLKRHGLQVLITLEKKK